MVKQAPLEFWASKMVMQMAIALVSHIDNELEKNASKPAQEKSKFVELEIHDFVSGFDRRMLMLLTNTFLLNCPAKLLNGKLLEKLIKSGW